MMVLDTLLYYEIRPHCDKVLPKEYGHAQQAIYEPKPVYSGFTEVQHPIKHRLPAENGRPNV